jgi:hypothetical protein
VQWTKEEMLAFDLGFALKRAGDEDPFDHAQA